jgi:hypothetical protein
MPTIKVAKPFKLLLAANEKPVEYGVGEHEVSDEVANHWHTQPHLEGNDSVAEPEGRQSELGQEGNDSVSGGDDDDAVSEPKPAGRGKAKG